MEEEKANVVTPSAEGGRPSPLDALRAQAAELVRRADEKALRAILATSAPAESIPELMAKRPNMANRLKEKAEAPPAAPPWAKQQLSTPVEAKGKSPESGIK